MKPFMAAGGRTRPKQDTKRFLRLCAFSSRRGMMDRTPSLNAAAASRRQRPLPSQS